LNEDYKSNLTNLEKLNSELEEKIKNLTNLANQLKEEKNSNNQQKYQILSLKKLELEQNTEIKYYKDNILNILSDNDTLKLDKDIIQKEKSKILNDMDYLKLRLEDSKNMQNSLIQSLTQNVTDNYRGLDLVETNQKLSNALDKVEFRNTNLENLLKELKKYESIFKSSVGIQCAACNKLI